MSVYEHIQRIAKSKKISIRQIEMDLGYSNGSLRKWKNSAPSDKLSRVADYLGTTPDYLILGHNTEPAKAPSKKENSNLDAIAAHIDDDVTEEEMRDIMKYIDFVKSQRDGKNE